jgi:hypothetical protein
LEQPALAPDDLQVIDYLSDAFDLRGNRSNAGFSFLLLLLSCSLKTSGATADATVHANFLENVFNDTLNE